MVVRRGRRKNLDVSWLPAASFKIFLVSVLLPTDTPLTDTPPPEILDFEKYFFISKGK